MKLSAKIILSAICLISTQALAKNICSESWETIYKKGYSAQFPKIQFGSIWLSIDGVCQSADHLYSAKPMEVCSGWGSGETHCTETEWLTLSTPITYEKEIPVGEGGWTTIEQSHPLNYKIPVGREGEAFMQVCEKAFTIPHCPERR